MVVTHDTRDPTPQRLSIAVSARHTMRGMPAATSAAPGSLELIRSFINTLDVEANHDEFAQAYAVKGWLVSRGLLDEGVAVAETDRLRLIEVREALRTLLLAQGAGQAHHDAVRTLDDAGALGGGLSVRFHQDEGARLTADHDHVAGAIAGMLAIIYTAMAQGTWARLKACQNDQCHWIFYDGSRNQSRRWCSMARCGSRSKARTFRRRNSEVLNPG